MVDTIITNLLATTLFITSSAFGVQTPAPQIVVSQTLPQRDFVSYTVVNEETLADIATKFYGSSDYWTNIQNDNPWISDPAKVQKGAMVKIKVTKPESVATLSTQDTEENTAVEENVTVVPTIAVIPTEVPAPKVSQAPTAAGTISEEAITYLGSCEAGNDPAKNTGNGYYGAFQFSPGTWNSLNTGYARADLAPIEVQRAAVKQLLQRSSIYNQFPGCAAKMRNNGLI